MVKVGLYHKVKTITAHKLMVQYSITLVVTGVECLIHINKIQQQVDKLRIVIEEVEMLLQIHIRESSSEDNENNYMIMIESNHHL